jgi:hypothetical protein
MLHVLGDACIQVIRHENEAAEALNDGQEVVELVGKAAQEFLVEALAMFMTKIQIRGKDKLHGVPG